MSGSIATAFPTVAPNDPSALSVKVHFGDDVRRFALETVSFEDLSKTIRSCYALPADAPISVKYLDDEQDWISVSSNYELRLATTFGNPIKLRVEATETGPAPGNAAPAPSSSSGDQKTRKEQIRELKEARKEQIREVKEARREQIREARRGCRGAKKTDAAQKKFLARVVAATATPAKTRFHTGEAFLQAWKLRNESDAPWPSDTQLVFKRGDQLASVDHVPLGKTVQPNEEVELTISMIAPMKAGNYVSVWRLSSESKEQGCRFFGQPLKVKIGVYPSSQLPH